MWSLRNEQTLTKTTSHPGHAAPFAHGPVSVLAGVRSMSTVPGRTTLLLDGGGMGGGGRLGGGMGGGGAGFTVGTGSGLVSVMGCGQPVIHTENKTQACVRTLIPLIHRPLMPTIISSASICG